MEKIKIKLNAGVVLVALIVFFAFVGVTGAEDWPMFMHDLEHTGETSDMIENPEDLELKWKFVNEDFGYLVESSPSVSGNYVYISSGNHIYCLDKTTGGLIWNFDAEDSLKSSPAISGNYVYTGSDGNYIYCLDKTTGELKWKFRTGYLFSFGLNYKQYFKEGEVNEQIRKIFENKEIYLSNPAEISKINEKKWRIGDRKEYYSIEDDNKELNVYEPGYSSSSSPAVSGDYVYVGSADDYIYCLDKNTGELKWKFDAGIDVESSPAVSGDYVYVGSAYGYIYCLDKNTGKEIWKFKTEGGVSSSPAVSGDYIYVGSDDHYLYCIDKNTGELKWKFEKFRSSDSLFYLESSPAVSVDYVYVGSAYGYIYCLDKNTGELKWKFDAGADVESSPAVSGGYVYVGSDDNHIYCLNKTTGELKWKFKTDSMIKSSPVISENYVYIHSWIGHVYAFGTEGPKQLSAYVPHYIEPFFGSILLSLLIFTLIIFFVIIKFKTKKDKEFDLNTLDDVDQFSSKKIKKPLAPYEWHVAISYRANNFEKTKDLDIAKDLANRLKNEKLKVFFDKHLENDKISKRLEPYFKTVFNSTYFAVIIRSEHYADDESDWTQFEKEIIIEKNKNLMKNEKRGYIIPIILDDCIHRGLPDDLYGFDLKKMSIDEIVKKIKVKVLEYQENKTKNEGKVNNEIPDKKGQSKPESAENSNVLSNPPIINDIKVSNSSIVEGESVEFSAKVAAEDMSTLNYLWDFGDGINGIGTDVSHQFLKPSKYTVTFKVTDKKGQNAFKSVIIYVEDIIKKEAAEIIVNEDDIQKILGPVWRYSKDATTTSKVRENGLSWYANDFSSDYANLNQKGLVRCKLRLQVSVTVFRSSKEAKNAFEDDHKRIFGNEKDYAAKEFNVGDEGFSSILLKGDKNIPITNYTFLKKNVLVYMFYGYGISGKTEEIDKKYMEDNQVLYNLGINNINEIRLAKLQESRISDK